MKKLSALLVAMLMTLTACGGMKTTTVVTRGFGSFDLPETFKKVSTDDEDGYSLLYSDKDDTSGYYMGQILLSGYLFDDGTTFEEFVEEVESDIFPNMAEYMYEEEGIGRSDIERADIEVDGKPAVRFSVKGDDDFNLEYIILQTEYDAETTIFTEAILSYHNKEYPKLGDLFLETYTPPID